MRSRAGLGSWGILGKVGIFIINCIGDIKSRKEYSRIRKLPEILILLKAVYEYGAKVLRAFPIG